MKSIKIIAVCLFLNFMLLSIPFAQAGKKKLYRLNGFKAKIGKEFVAMKCDNRASFSVRKGILQAKGGGHLWTDKISYDVTGNKKIIVESQVKLHLDSEFIIGFSKNLRGWVDAKSEDALTFRTGCNKKDTMFTLVRSQMYRKYVATSQHILSPGKWYVVKIILSSKQLIAYFGNREVLRADLSKTKFPKVGHIGLLSFNNVPTHVKYINISSGQKVHPSKKRILNEKGDGNGEIFRTNKKATWTHKHLGGPKKLILTGEIDGSEEIFITNKKATWTHKHWGWPKNIRINGIKWNPQKTSFLLNRAYTKYLPVDVDFSLAKVISKSGRDTIVAVPEKNGIRIYLADTPNGSGSYKIIISFDKKRKGLLKLNN